MSCQRVTLGFPCPSAHSGFSPFLHQDSESLGHKIIIVYISENRIKEGNLLYHLTPLLPCLPMHIQSITSLLVSVHSFPFTLPLT